ncbi:DUF2306 domain-containing protein [Bacillus sp. RG28]|uniref:DUF2306 domain-containing protein n=1 Tax=Gottfriedia endophytica TaxID=2820819 RepID=A0A940NP15_9BACI|nr:DUF2306 domain-containing protein [Gottfriedia endophytica]MBP0726156.1 DUF2306 domain-containing protein [Gottfriedia endophytica]
MFKLFLVLHIITGIICLITGLLAGFSKKRRGKHSFYGEIYHGSYFLVFITAVVMSILHWNESAYLFYIAIFSYSLALLGYIAAKKRWKNWLGSHIGGMLGSYIGIVTATLVVNAKSIPLINNLPILLVWFLPTIIGTPIIIKVGRKYNR